MLDHYGRFRKFISDKMLKFLLVELIINEYENLKDLQAVTYNVGITVFESVLEHGCEAGGNGHHVAQALAKYFKK